MDIPYNEPFIMAFTLVFPAEMYDKSQIMILFLLTLYSASAVFSGATIGILLANVPMIVLAQFAGQMVPSVVATLFCFIVFCALGLMALNSRPPGNVISKKLRYEFSNPVYTCALACFLTEFGDKTQSVVASLALYYQQSLSVILGFTFAVIITNYILISFKDLVTMNIFALYRLSGYVFLGFGVLMGIGILQYIF